MPDTSTFPPDSYAALMRQVAEDSCARALQYSPTEGLEVVKRCIIDIMAAEGIGGVDAGEVLVTTGGQQVIDLVCKTLIDPGDVLRTLRELDGGEFVVYLGTFSKVLSPGVRLGWTVAPRRVLDKMNLGEQSADLCSSALTQHFVAAYFESGHWDEYLRSLTEIYRRRRDTMLDALADHLPREAEWTHPAGG